MTSSGSVTGNGSGPKRLFLLLLKAIKYILNKGVSFSHINQKSLSHLQLVHNAAARLLTGFHRQQTITPILAYLHWLSVCFDFKMWLIPFKACMGLTPTYTEELLTPYEPACRSSGMGGGGGGLLAVSKSRLKTKGERGFAVRPLGLRRWGSQSQSSLLNHFLQPISTDCLLCDVVASLLYFIVEINLVYLYHIDWFYHYIYWTVLSGFNSLTLSLSCFVGPHCWAFCCFIALLLLFVNSVFKGAIYMWSYY